MIRTILIDTGAEFALIVRGRYGSDGLGSVQVLNASDRPETQRAEVLRLIADLLAWAAENGIALEDGAVRG